VARTPSATARRGRRIRICRLACATLALAVLVLPPAPAQAFQSAEQQLAEKYSPVLSLEPQPKPCGPGEAYRPTTVDIVLGRQDVLLRDASGRVIERAPTAGDLWRHAKGYYIDLPGDPLRPGCGYERQFRTWNDGRMPSVYARVATDPAYPGKLAVEYWFYYTFNDFTDKHESDWEMSQVDFDASNAAEALLTGPYEVDVSQHAGGERSLWTDTKLEKLVTVVLLTITVVGIPFAIHRFIRWSLFAQACMLGDLSATESLRGSSVLIRGRWWRTFGFTVLVDVLAILSGPLFGVGLLLVTDHSLNFINLAAALVYTVTVPFAAIQLTLLLRPRGEPGAAFNCASTFQVVP
jgi:hypothetical protein